MNFNNYSTAQVPAAWLSWAAAFRALAHPVRLAVFQLIRHPADCCSGPRGTVCACDIAQKLELSAPMVSHHLKELRLADLIQTEKRGQWVHCSVNYDALRLIDAFIHDSAVPDGARPARESADLSHDTQCRGETAQMLPANE